MHINLQRFAIIITALFVLFTMFFYYSLESYYKEEAFKRIEQTVRFDKALQQYVNDVQKPLLTELKRTNRLSKDYFSSKLLSSTFIANSINDNYTKASLYPVRIKFASDTPTNPRNKADSYEKEILSQFREKNLSSLRDTRTINGVNYLFYALPVNRNTQDCLQCHGIPEDAPVHMLDLYGKKNGFHEKIGYLRAIVAVYTPVNTTDDNWHIFFWSIEALMLFIFGLIFFLIVYFERKLLFKDRLIAEQSRLAAMGEMIEMIAHQWRQPLSGMGMTVSNLKLDIELSTIDEEKWEAQLTVIEGQIAYLSHTIDDFRNFFKPNQDRSLVYINKVIESTLNLVASTLKNHDIKIMIDCYESVTVTTSKNELIQVLLNLVKNTIDAYIDSSNSSPTIEISVIEDEEYVTIAVKDHAGGIPSAIIHDVFIPYFTTKGEKNGSGMGLYMSKIIIEEHLGGRLEVESDNGWTIFTIKLPIGSPDGN